MLFSNEATKQFIKEYKADRFKSSAKPAPTVIVKIKGGTLYSVMSCGQHGCILTPFKQ